VEYPRVVAPVVGSVLWVISGSTGHYELEASWGFYGISRSRINSIIEAPDCPNCTARTLQIGRDIETCHQADRLDPQFTRQCIPLTVESGLIGMLHLFLPAGYQLSADQLAEFSHMQSEMAVAVDRSRSKRMNSVLIENAETERRKIARELHDNLVQNLLFLRQKLEVMTSQPGFSQEKSLREDIDRMQAVVDETYLSLRSTLREIEANNRLDLVAIINDYILSVQDQMHFSLHADLGDQPVHVPARVARQVLYILGEAINNIEKHAGARLVEVRLSRETGNVLLSVTDDGKGFELHSQQADGHMGLLIMRERAEEINGRMMIKSSPGNGTEMILWVPALNPLREVEPRGVSGLPFPQPYAPLSSSSNRVEKMH